MKELSALGAAALIATACVLWFMTKPTVVTAEVKPLQPNSELPVFRPVRPNGP